MKTGIVTPAYNEERFIGACIKQFNGFPVDHLILVSKTPWNGEPFPVDKTEEIARKLGAKVMVDDFPPDEHQRHIGLDYFKNYDWCLIVDADEFYTREDIKKILDYLETADKEVYSCGKMLVYFKDLDSIAVREIGHKPPIMAMRPHMRFSGIRGVDYPFYFIPDTTLYHLSYVRTNAELVKKISTFGHSHEIIPNWYQDVWMKWTPQSVNFHPTEPDVFARSEVSPVPDQIRELLK